MSLQTERLILRPWQLSDAEDLYEYAKSPEVGPIAGWKPHESVAESAEIIRTVFSQPQVYAVVLKETNQAIGCIGLLDAQASNFVIGGNDAEVAYWIGVPYWGKGLIPEALTQLINYAFSDLELDNLWCGYYADNQKSHRAQEKCGFQFQRTEENKFNPFLNDYRTEHITRLTKQEWLAR
ncbi:GNAT family N-acetyltransferase [Pseudomonas sp. F1_0610]|uniref:GNAT family N-acetyltransferase n=1 Tax=Pseudomonas sp. F1_0610 TaxID=3114284 RepID=UPI0039C1AEC1